MVFLRVRCFVRSGGRENWSFFVPAKKAQDVRWVMVICAPASFPHWLLVAPPVQKDDA